jgi:hypothetical protein
MSGNYYMLRSFYLGRHATGGLERVNLFQSDGLAMDLMLPDAKEFPFLRKGIEGVALVVSVLATGPKGCGFKTRLRRWIFKGDKNPQHNFLSDGK